jgi:hypothetical protein
MLHRIVFSFSLLACASDPSRSIDGGKSDGQRSEHARAVRTCEQDSTSAAALHACLRAANEAATDTIDGLIPEGELDFSSLSLFEGYEERAAVTCDAFGGSVVEDLRADFIAQCRAARSRDLAALIDAYVAFDDGEQVPVTHREADFIECRTAYNAALATSESTQDSVQAALALAECVDTEVAPVATALAGLLDLPEEEARATIQAALDAALEGSINACTVVAAAGGEAGGSLESVHVSACQADAAQQVGTQVFDSVPME